MFDFVSSMFFSALVFKYVRRLAKAPPKLLFRVGALSIMKYVALVPQIGWLQHLKRNVQEHSSKYMMLSRDGAVCVL